jgi:hypothetical protein
MKFTNDQLTFQSNTFGEHFVTMGPNKIYIPSQQLAHLTM